MSMKRWVGIVSVFIIAGCAGTPVKPTREQLKPVAETLEKEPVSKVRHETSIDPNVLYLLMTAEIAGQRNQYNVALDGYLQAAKIVKDPRIAERAAKIGLFLKDTRRSEEAIRLWLQEEPDNLTARKVAVLSALTANEQAQAIDQLNAVMQLDPAGFESTLLEMSKMMAKSGKDAFFFEVLEELSRQNPDQAEIFFVQSLLAAKLKKNELAQQKIERALALQPDWKKAIIFQARLAARAGDLDTARKGLEKVLKMTPDDRRIRKMLAQVYLDTKDYDQAIELYRQVLQEKPDDGESQFAVALIQIQQNQLDSAKKSLKALLHNPAWAAQASFYLGRIEFRKEHFDQALIWFDKVTQGPYAFDAAMSAVSVLINQKRYDEALARINDLKQKFPRQQLRIMLVNAEVYSSMLKYQDAFEVLTEALQIYPDNRDLLYTRALIAEQIDRLDILEADLKKILKKQPDDAATLNALGYTLVDKTDRYDEAEKYLVQALQLQPDEAVIIDSYGWLQYKRGNLQQALKYLQKAYDKQPENEIAAHLAEVLWMSGDRESARLIFEKALLNAPDDQYLLDFKRRILQQE